MNTLHYFLRFLFALNKDSFSFLFSLQFAQLRKNYKVFDRRSAACTVQFIT